MRTPLHPPVPRPAGGSRLPCARALLALAAMGGGCALPGQDMHLSPFVSSLSTAGGGTEIEALAGVVQVRRDEPGGPVRLWALRPLTSTLREPFGESTRFLVPLGTVDSEGSEKVIQLLPIARYQQEIDEHGELAWKFLMLPGIFWSKDNTGRIVRAFFPIGGVIEDFVTFDRIEFVLFPLYMRTQRAGRTTWHFLFPFFMGSTKPGLPNSGRFWPFYGVSHTETHERRFWLWPIFHKQSNDLRRPPEQRESRWMVWPFWGRTRAGSYRATTVAWPFFGFARNPDTGYWAWDGPWPFVRVQRPGTTNEARRTRFWPLYSHLKDRDFESTWLPWPIFNRRHETYLDSTRDGTVSIPVWQSWTRRDREGQVIGSWWKLWPLAQERIEEDQTRSALPALNPLWHTPVVDYHYAWLYELYTRETRGEESRERSWGGLWRREVDSGEQRTYLAGIWARRAYVEEGAEVKETSLLLGLLRWRHREGRGRELMWPAFPGPGWPHARRTGATAP